MALAALSVAAFSFFRRSFRTAFLDKRLSLALTLVTCCQFHLPFYMSRPLANTFAMMGTNIAHGFWLRGQHAWCVSALAFTTIVFRCDVIVLAAPLLLCMSLCGVCWLILRCCALRCAVTLALKWTDVLSLIKAGVVASALSIGQPLSPCISVCVSLSLCVALFLSHSFALQR